MRKTGGAELDGGLNSLARAVEDVAAKETEKSFAKAAKRRRRNRWLFAVLGPISTLLVAALVTITQNYLEVHPVFTPPVPAAASTQNGGSSVAESKSGAHAPFTQAPITGPRSNSPDNPAAAKIQWESLASNGDAAAQEALGNLYLRPATGFQDYSQGVKWLTLAAEQRRHTAQTTLGTLYQLGRGVPQDYVLAVKWHQSAAERGSADSQAALGVIYANVDGTEHNYGESNKWFELAAAQGNRDAQTFLGASYAKGRGVRQDYTMAFVWYSAAAEAGDLTAARGADLAMSLMSTSSRARAKQLVARCIDSGFKNCSRY